jgi:hypothetical protein
MVLYDLICYGAKQAEEIGSSYCFLLLYDIMNMSSYT